MAGTSQHIKEDICGQEEKKTRGTKRSATQLSAAPPAAKKRKTTRRLARLLTHEVVLEDVWAAGLLDLLGEFLCRRCPLIEDLIPYDSAILFRTLDMMMVEDRLQKAPFICPGTVVFLYMLCRDSVSAEVANWEELRAVLLTCFYVSCSYIGPRIGYQESLFIVEDDRQAFWKRTFDITKRMSRKMLQINMSPLFFKKVLDAMKNRTDH